MTPLSSDLLILCADTSLPVLSVSLTKTDILVGEVALEGKSSRNEKLLPAIDWLLRESGVERHQIDLLVVTRGPGSFTGVRVGLATFQGLSIALSKPLCAMSTHEAALAYVDADSLLVVDEAGRGEFYASGYRYGREVLPPSLFSASEVESAREEYEKTIQLRELVTRANVAVLGAARARQIIESGRLEEYRDMRPIYVRLAEAEVRLNQSPHG